MKVREHHALWSKGLAVAVSAVAFATLGGTAAAAPAAAKQTAAGKQYEKIVAPFNKLVNQQNAPAVSKLRGSIEGTEKKLRTGHWPKKAGKDVKLLAKDLGSVEGIFLDEAKSSNFTPNAKQAAAGQKFLGQITKVHKDLGLAPTNDQGL